MEDATLGDLLLLLVGLVVLAAKAAWGMVTSLASTPLSTLANWLVVGLVLYAVMVLLGEWFDRRQARKRNPPQG